MSQSLCHFLVTSSNALCTWYLFYRRRNIVTRKDLKTAAERLRGWGHIHQMLSSVGIVHAGLNVYAFHAYLSGSIHEWHNVFIYLLHILLKHTQLKSLVQPEFAVLQETLQAAILMNHLMNQLQNPPHRLTVVGPCCQRPGVSRRLRPLQHIQ